MLFRRSPRLEIEISCRIEKIVKDGRPEMASEEGDIFLCNVGEMESTHFGTEDTLLSIGETTSTSTETIRLDILIRLQVITTLVILSSQPRAFSGEYVSTLWLDFLLINS